MKTNIPTTSVAETAHLLRTHLGPLRNWTNFLNDNIRYKQNVAGNTLMPCARIRGGRGSQPVYDVRAVKAFIDKVLAAVPSAGKAKVKSITLTVDTSKDWSLNKFDKNGIPCAILHSICASESAGYVH